MPESPEPTTDIETDENPSVSSGSGKQSEWRRLRNRIIAGLFVLLPIYITYAIVRWLYVTLYDYAIGPIASFLREFTFKDAAIPGYILYGLSVVLAMFVVVAILIIAGVFAKSRLVSATEWVLQKVPGVNTIYRVVSNVFATPFDLILSSPLPAFSLYHSPTSTKAQTIEQREDYLDRLESTIQAVYKTLLKTQTRYKKDFDKRVRPSNRNIRAGQYVYLDPTDGTTKGVKLVNHALGPYRVITNDKRTFVIQRGEQVKRVNADQVTYAPPPLNAPPPEPLEATEQDVRDKKLEGRTYVFDKILKHRVNKDGSLDFLIKWHGYKKPTWQPRSDISQEAISYYLSNKRRSARAAN